jgi:uncharacterized protein (TIGR02996 family)
MNLEQGFLDDIVRNPTDPTPWLVFADWLEERDDPRGELVRLLRLCWDEPASKTFKARHARLQELFASGVRLPLPKYTNSLGMEFVWVPPGEFWMGGGDGKCGDKHVVMPQPFYLGIYPVTQGQWRAVMGSNPSYASRRGAGAKQVNGISDADLDLFPVEEVSWERVRGFLAKLNRRALEGWTYRLPTEEEWEYALRSPVTSQADCAFSFYLDQPADALSSDQANFDGEFPANAALGPLLGRTSKVGSYPANRLGIYDLHGNVWEWTQTSAGAKRVIRGGAWKEIGFRCAAAYRGVGTPEERFDSVGFRLVRVLPGQQ